MNKSGQSTLGAIISIVAGMTVLALFAVVIFFVGRWIFSAYLPKTEAATKTDNSRHVAAGDAFENPIKLQADDIRSTSGENFAKKYAGKWIAFDASIAFGIVTTDQQPTPRLMMYFNDADTLFSDRASFSISADSRTFSTDLQQLVNTNSSGLDGKKVHVVARVGQYIGGGYNSVVLTPNDNATGKTPSVTSR